MARGAGIRRASRGDAERAWRAGVVPQRMARMRFACACLRAANMVAPNMVSAIKLPGGRQGAAESCQRPLPAAGGRQVCQGAPGAASHISCARCTGEDPGGRTSIEDARYHRGCTRGARARKPGVALGFPDGGRSKAHLTARDSHAGAHGPSCGRRAAACMRPSSQARDRPAREAAAPATST